MDVFLVRDECEQGLAMAARLRGGWFDNSRDDPQGTAVVFSGALLALPMAATDNLSVFDPASSPAYSIRNLFVLVLAILGVIFLLVEGLLLYCVFRFRSPSGTAASEPPQIYGSRPIEVAWTVAPVLIVFVLFLVVIRSVADVRQIDPPRGALRVTVVGHQWWWEFRYPELGIITANELHVPVSDLERPQPVYLELESVDVIHSFWVPRLAGKTDVIPGRTNRMWFQPLQPGIYHGQCAEYCGAQHANMMIRVIADPPEGFQQWLDNQRRSTEDNPAGKKGKTVFLARGCVNCHTIRGTPAQGTVGPDLTHLMSRQTLAAGVVPNDHEHLLAWVADPQQIKPACRMPSMHLSGPDVDRIVAYLETLR